MDELETTEEALKQAMLASDVPALERLLDDALMCTTIDGRALGKAEDLGPHRAGALRIQTMDASDRRVVMHGDTAVVVGRMAASFSFGGNQTAATMRYTRVSMKRAQGWRLISQHFSAI